MTHRALGRRGRFLCIEHDRGVFGELVHVDDVRERTQMVERVQYTLALDALLQREHEPDSRTEQDQQAHGRFQALEQFRRCAGNAFKVQEAECCDLGDEARGNERARRPAPQIIRPRQRGRFDNAHASRFNQFRANPAQACIWKPRYDARMELLQRRDDVVGAELLIASWHGRSMHCRALRFNRR